MDALKSSTPLSPGMRNCEYVTQTAVPNGGLFPTAIHGLSRNSSCSPLLAVKAANLRLGQQSESARPNGEEGAQEAPAIVLGFALYTPMPFGLPNGLSGS